MAKLRVKNWSNFQHYKDRRPPWIKLHRELLDNLEYHMLTAEAGKALPLIWLIASELDGSLPEIPIIAFRLRMTVESAQTVCADLGRHGFLTEQPVEQVATRAEPWPSRHVPDKLRLSVSKRDEGKCKHCGSMENIEFDHVIPVSKGGTSVEDNLQLLCRSCNRKKRVKLAEQVERAATQKNIQRSPETETETETETDGKALDGSALESSEKQQNIEPVREVFDYYLTQTGRTPNTYSFTPSRQRIGLSRFSECLKKTRGDPGKAQALMKLCVDAIVASDFHMGREAKSNGKKYIEWEKNLFKSQEQMEAWWHRVPT